MTDPTLAVLEVLGERAACLADRARRGDRPVRGHGQPDDRPTPARRRRPRGRPAPTGIGAGARRGWSSSTADGGVSSGSTPAAARSGRRRGDLGGIDPGPGRPTGPRPGRRGALVDDLVAPRRRPVAESAARRGPARSWPAISGIVDHADGPGAPLARPAGPDRARPRRRARGSARRSRSRSTTTTSSRRSARPRSGPRVGCRDVVFLSLGYGLGAGRHRRRAAGPRRVANAAGAIGYLAAGRLEERAQRPGHPGPLPRRPSPAPGRATIRRRPTRAGPDARERVRARRPPATRSRPGSSPTSLTDLGDLVVDVGGPPRSRGHRGRRRADRRRERRVRAARASGCARPCPTRPGSSPSALARRRRAPRRRLAGGRPGPSPAGRARPRRPVGSGSPRARHWL